MREIKFRVWSKPKKEMREVTNNWCIGDLKQKGFIVMQYTGLKDKNGKEIYEGDVVEYHVPQAGFSTAEVFTHVVEWRDGLAGYNRSWKKEWEVVGNIYENPELLGNKTV